MSIPGVRTERRDPRSVQVSCNRYAGELITHTAQTPIAVSWRGDWTLHIELEEVSLRWEVVLTEPPMARALNAPRHECR